MESFPAHRALRTELHLACVRGPDRGCVVPVEVGLVLGRGRDGVTDPYCPRNFAVVDVSHDRRGRQRTYLLPHRGRHRKLRAGAQVKMGTNRWVVRSRAARLTWPGSLGRAPTAGRMRILRWMMPVFILAFILRLLPREYWLILGSTLAVSALMGVVLWARAGRRWDEASLLLTVASRESPKIEDSPSGARSEQIVTVLAKPASRWKLKLDADGGAVAVVGNAGLGLQQWLLGQSWALGADPDVGLFDSLGQTPTSTSLVVPARSVGSASWCHQMKRALSARDTLASLVHFSDVVGRPLPTMVLSEWARASTRKELVAAVGIGQSGIVHLDFGDQGPHALVVGGTGSGKSEFLSTLVLSLAATHSPKDLRFVFIDFKGGAGLDHLADLPHVEHSISDLDGTRVAWLLRALDKALQRRKRTMAKLGARSWSEARSPGVGPRLMVVVDEFQILSETHPDLMDRLAKLAAQGRSLGFHLVLASQRPGGAITPALRATLDLRVALRCTEKRDSVEVISVADAADLPRIPGRAIVGSQQVQLALETNVDSWVSTISEVWEDPVLQSDLDGEEGAVIPRSLPGTVNHQSGTLGTYECPRDSTLQPLLDRGASVGIFGPRSHEGELAQLAATFTSSVRTIWIGVAPPTMVGSQEVCDIRRRGDVEIIPPEDLGAVARTLVRITKGRHNAQVVVIQEVSRLLSRLESMVGVEQCASVWEGLVRASSGSGAAPAAGATPWRLVVTDSKPRGHLGGLEVSVLRIPSRQTLLWGPLSGVLPTQMPGAPGVPVTRPVDLEEFASPIWGRVLVNGLVDGQTVWAQFALPAPPPAPLPPPAPSHPALTTHPQPPVSVLAGPSMGGISVGTTVLKPAVCDLDLESQLTSLVERGLLSSVLPADAWPRVATTAGPLLVVDPTKEVLRILAGRFPTDAVWLQASFPLPRGSAVLTNRDGADYLNAEQVQSLLAFNTGDPFRHHLTPN